MHCKLKSKLCTTNYVVLKVVQSSSVLNIKIVSTRTDNCLQDKIASIKLNI